MTQETWLKRFKEAGAFLEGHFLLSSGLHSSHYIQCALLFEDPKLGEALAKELASFYKDNPPGWVVGPAMGGILLAYELARQLKAKNAFTERVDGKMLLRRGFVIPAGSKVVVAEDVLTTGGSVLEVARCLEAQGAKILGVAALVDRTGAELPYPKHPLVSLQLTAHPPDQCRLCLEGKPLVKPGSRKE